MAEPPLLAGETTVFAVRPGFGGDVYDGPSHHQALFDVYSPPSLPARLAPLALFLSLLAALALHLRALHRAGRLQRCAVMGN